MTKTTRPSMKDFLNDMPKAAKEMAEQIRDLPTESFDTSPEITVSREYETNKGNKFRLSVVLETDYDQ